MPVMSHRMWMNRTYVSAVSIRSDKMKAIDAALLAYESRGRTGALLWQVQLKLQAWIDSKGKDWKSSDRNKNHAIENLQAQIYAELYPARAGGATAGSTASFAATLLESRKNTTKRVFEGTQLTLKSSYKAHYGLSRTEAGFTVSNVRNMYKGAVALGAPSPEADRSAVRGAVRDAASAVHGGGEAIVRGGASQRLRRCAKRLRLWTR